MAKRKKGKVPEKYIRTDSDRKAIELGCYWDQAAGDWVLSFFRNFLKQSKGRWGGKPFELLQWQIDLILQLYCWKNKDGLRRFRQVYVEIAKKNGKTTLVAGLSLYHLIADREQGAEVFIFASDREQARTLFSECKAMVKQSPALQEILKVTKNQIDFEATFSKLRVCTADPDSNDGGNISFSVIDELHRQKTPALHNLLTVSGVSRDAPILFEITTAGSSRDSICRNRHEHAKAVLSNKVIDVTFLGVLHCAEPGDDFEAIETIKKANPSLGVTIRESDFRNELAQAKRSAISWHDFLRYRYCIWTSGDVKFINPTKWALNDKPVDPEQLRGSRCWAGCDLSSVADTSALILLFEDGSILPYCFLPESQIDTNPNYRQWWQEGHIIITPGEVIDYDYIAGVIKDTFAKYQFESMFLDPYNAYQLTQKIEMLGVNLNFHRQNMLNMNGCTKELERLILSGQLKHGNNPVLAWQMENSVAKIDPIGNCMLVKENAASKIDMAVALCMAVQARMVRDY